MHLPDDVATRSLGARYDALDGRAQRVARHAAAHKHIARVPAAGASSGG